MKSIFIQYGVLASQAGIQYAWVFVDVYSSDPGTWDLYYEGNGSGGNISGMISELTAEYDPEVNSGLYAVYYDLYDTQYYLFVAEPV